MKQSIIFCLRLISVLLILMMTSVAYAQETPVGRAVTRADWEDHFPVLAIIVIFTLTVTGIFFYLAIRNLRRA